MMLPILLGIQATVTGSPIPPAPRPLPPFTREVEAVARLKGSRVSAAYKVCSDARTNADGRWVDAMGTRPHSNAWNIATFALEHSLTVCQEQRQALREQAEFIENIIVDGSSHDSEVAAQMVDGVVSEFKAGEQYYATETPRYRQLLVVGWGSPHCIPHADGYAPNSSICAAGENPLQP